MKKKNCEKKEEKNLILARLQTEKPKLQQNSKTLFFINFKKNNCN